MFTSKRLPCVVLAMALFGLLRADDCGPGTVALVVQDAPVMSAQHQTRQLFANAVESVTVDAPLGKLGTATLFGALVSQLDGTGGVQGWSILLYPEGDLMITAGSTDGTAAAPAPEGLFRNGFERTFLNPLGRCSAALASAVVPSFTEQVTLLPHGTSTVLRFDVEATVPQGFSEIHGAVTWLDELCRACRGVACASGYLSIVTVDGDSRNFCDRQGASITFREIRFRRGDSNADGKVDISDAVRIFMHLFLGAAEPACLDSADTNDDGWVDISDGILILKDFFRPGTAISAPGPLDCGVDPTGDALSCAGYSVCD
jgi:hypothetical protein